jgi:alpha-galactosidase
MKNKFLALILISIVALSSAFAQKFENLADAPAMGWNSWNKFACNIDEQTIRGVEDMLVASGLRDAGYVYLNLDDCWHGERDSLGFITADPIKFPSGMKALADYIHSRGLKFGVYSDAGRTTCGGRPGSFGHEYQDAITYAQWGVDYLKYDWCASDNINAKGAYSLMRDALHNAKRPVYFSMCEWGDNHPWEWASDVGHSWRTTGDISNCFDCEIDYGGWKSLGVLQIIDKNEPLRKYAGRGHWNDPDMLEVGNGMSVNQDRAHFTMWCMMAAPLILGNDIRNMSTETTEILLNKEVIAIDQDELGIQGLRFKVENGLEFWLKPLAGGDWAFCILNRSQQPIKYTIDWNNFDMRDNFSGYETTLRSQTYSIRNLWTKKDEGKTNIKKEVVVAAQDVLLFRLKK